MSLSCGVVELSQEIPDSVFFKGATPLLERSQKFSQQVDGSVKEVQYLPFRGEFFSLEGGQDAFEGLAHSFDGSEIYSPCRPFQALGFAEDRFNDPGLHFRRGGLFQRNKAG